MSRLISTLQLERKRHVQQQLDPDNRESKPLAEAHAALLVITIAAEMGYGNWDREGDTLNVIIQLQNHSLEPDWPIEHLIEEARYFFNFYLIGCKSHRETNIVAHNIAKWAIFCNMSGLIPISSIPDHCFCPQDRDGGNPSFAALFLCLVLLFFNKVFLGTKKKQIELLWINFIAKPSPIIL